MRSTEKDERPSWEKKDRKESQGKNNYREEDREKKFRGKTYKEQKTRDKKDFSNKRESTDFKTGQKKEGFLRQNRQGSGTFDRKREIREIVQRQDDQYYREKTSKTDRTDKEKKTTHKREFMQKRNKDSYDIYDQMYSKAINREKEPEKDPRLNKFIANAGICSRREADKYIVAGSVTINGEPVKELGYRVKKGDVVRFDGKIIKGEKNEYLLLNKPKGFISTTSDEKGRKTVMELVEGATTAKIKPVGRLDRQTTGLLLFTNDGDLMKKLTHPSHGVRKIYHVVLDKNLDLAHFHKIQEGITLEDGFIEVDEIKYVEGATRKEVGVKIHSGRNRIVRRIFQSLGYEVEKLDRVVFANLTKKDLPRGSYRFLTEQEIINLKNLS